MLAFMLPGLTVVGNVKADIHLRDVDFDRPI